MSVKELSQPKSSQLVVATAKRLFAMGGYEGVSMRTLAVESGVGLSSIYHFFADKDLLLKYIYDEVNTALGAARQALEPQPSAELMLAQRIAFQLDHIEDIIFVIKYYMHYRQDFAALPAKTLPLKASLHIEEVLRQGLDSGELAITHAEVAGKAKIITHMINGFLLEYYPHPPQGKRRQELIAEIVDFSMSSLKQA